MIRLFFAYNLNLKFIYSEKATNFSEISTADLSYVSSNGQIYGGDFTKFCGLLRIYELYHKHLFVIFRNEAVHVKFPKTIDDAKQLGTVLSKYKDKYYAQVLGGVFVTYLFLQTFAIPGSIFLSIVSGYLFPFPVALLLVRFFPIIKG